MADELPGSGDAGGSAPVDTSAAAATPIALTDTSSFIPPGGKEPTTWNKFQSGFVSKDELTRMRQRDAQERQTWQQTERQRMQREYEQQQQQRQAPQGQQGNDFLAKLEAAPYVDGKTVAGIVREMAQQLSRSQQAMQMVVQQNQQLQQSVQGINGKWSQNELGTMFATTKKNLGLPESPDIDQFLEDVYHSHTGWETAPGEFERMVGARWNGFVAAQRAADKARADAARSQSRPFAPGQPGVGKPKNPLVKGNESAEDIANRMWPGMSGVST